MARLMDIKGYWNMYFEWNFNHIDMWEGKILLQNDGWFEGIVVDPNSHYTEDRFIFGVYHPEKIIELFKFTPLKVSSPFVFHGRRDAKGYDGIFEIIGLFDTNPCGNSHIITKYAKENINEEKRKLESKIQRYKSSIMDKTCKKFYDNAIIMREYMTKLFLGNYEGKKFTPEEMEEFKESFDLVTEGVIEAIEKSFLEQIKDLFE